MYVNGIDAAVANTEQVHTRETRKHTRTSTNTRRNTKNPRRNKNTQKHTSANRVSHIGERILDDVAILLRDVRVVASDPTHTRITRAERTVENLRETKRCAIVVVILRTHRTHSSTDQIRSTNEMGT